MCRLDGYETSYWSVLITEVLLAMQSVGICGSDIHFYRHGRVGDYVMKKPLVMGHEASGLVVATGHGVTNIKVGKQCSSLCTSLNCVHNSLAHGLFH